MERIATYFIKLRNNFFYVLQYENEMKLGFWTKKALTRPEFSNSSGEVCFSTRVEYYPLLCLI